MTSACPIFQKGGKEVSDNFEVLDIFIYCEDLFFALFHSSVSHLYFEVENFVGKKLHKNITNKFPKKK